MLVFQYVIFFEGKKTKDGEWKEKPCLLNGGVQTIVAKNEEQASMLAARDIPEEYLEKLDKVRIAVRPF